MIVSTIDPFPRAIGVTVSAWRDHPPLLDSCTAFAAVILEIEEKGYLTIVVFKI
jgi:hypothetical protein